jgi:hypothetical protein
MYRGRLINYANETLQNFFTSQLFDAELELYRSEDITFTVTSRPDNSECLSLIAGEPGDDDDDDDDDDSDDDDVADADAENTYDDSQDDQNHHHHVDDDDPLPQARARAFSLCWTRRAARSTQATTSFARPFTPSTRAASISPRRTPRRRLTASGSSTSRVRAGLISRLF